MQSTLRIGLALLALAKEVENEFDAARNAQLVVNAEEIIAHRVLAEAKSEVTSRFESPSAGKAAHHLRAS